MLGVRRGHRFAEDGRAAALELGHAPR
jgi:hypothetical protein